MELDKELFPDYVYPEYKPDPNEPFRPIIAELGKAITDRIPQKLGLAKITKDDPEYWGLAAMCTDEMAEVALKMGVRKPKTLKQMAEATGKSEEYLEPLLEKMALSGVIEYNWENPQHEKQYVLPMFVPGSAEFSNMSGFLDTNPELGIFFERMTRLPLDMVTKFVPEGGSGIGMHVIPVEKAIEMESQSVSVEHISHWLDKYDGVYAKSPCSCRRSRKTHGEGCGDDPEGWCIAVGDMAHYVVETNKGGKYITREEALEIMKIAEDNGFVHEITNIDGENKIFAICNCNVNVCYALRTSQLYNTPNMSRSAYIAHVDRDKCVACGKCVEVCPAGAPKLGQKLCRKDGTDVEYPKHELPYVNEPWGEDKWTHNYRDVNRIPTYDTGTAPCKTACPAHISIQGYIDMAKNGRYDEALELIKLDNPLPAICGHICNRRCEDACTRGTIDDPVAIDEIKKFVAMRDLNKETRYVPEKIIPSLNKDFYADTKIAIIGAGPAGLSCAYYLALKGYKPTVFEKNDRPGGMLTYGVPSFKLEKNVIEAEVDIIKELGVEFKYGVEVGKDVTLDALRADGYKAFYVAIGCQGGRKAGVAGEDAEGVYTAVEFLRETAATEKFALGGGNVVVIGGGNVAIDAARSAVRCGNGAVSMYCLESRDEMPALDEEIADAESDGITINNSWGPKEILTENGKVKAVVFKKCTSVFDGGKFAPKYDENDTITVECTDVIVSIGQVTEWGGIPECRKASKLTYQSETADDIFVGGDVYTGPKFAIDAIAAGREGAISIHRFVQPNCTLTIGRDRRNFVELNKADIKVDSYDTQARNKANRKNLDKNSFRDYMETFTEDQVKAETERCLKCGRSVVDENKCLGCGLCTTKCHFDAIHLTRDLPGCSTMRTSEEKLKYIIPNMIKYPVGLKIRKLKEKKD
ncbi:MAG: FAD-dependent oxidoreductase [Oscillospiraceae bacterium]|nr:FAD-dependent oxidoreductase [Candidatus Limimonas egerieequi]